MKLLIIDDEEDLLDCLKDSISFLFPDLIILLANNVDQATALIGSVDIVLSDINMPRRQDLETLLATCGKPVGRITGHDDSNSELVAYKPYTEESLSSVLNQLFNKVGKQ